MSQSLYSTYRQLWLDPAGVPASFEGGSAAFCCADMTGALTNSCDTHPNDPFECPDMLLSYSPVFDEFGLIVHDGSASSFLIAHCPWCGQQLPQSRRERWFHELEALGFVDPLGEAAVIPEAYKTSEWWRSSGERTAP